MKQNGEVILQGSPLGLEKLHKKVTGDEVASKAPLKLNIKPNNYSYLYKL